MERVIYNYPWSDHSHLTPGGVQCFHFFRDLCAREGRAGRSDNPGCIMHIFARTFARDRARLCRGTHTNETVHCVSISEPTQGHNEWVQSMAFFISLLH